MRKADSCERIWRPEKERGSNQLEEIEGDLRGHRKARTCHSASQKRNSATDISRGEGTISEAPV